MPLPPPLVRKIIQRLTKEFPLFRLETVDERYTSKMASRLWLIWPQQNNARIKYLVMEIAATIMLQEYLQQTGYSCCRQLLSDCWFGSKFAVWVNSNSVSRFLPIVAYGAPILRWSVLRYYPDHPGWRSSLLIWKPCMPVPALYLVVPQVVNKDIRVFVVDSAQIFENLDDDEVGK